MVGLKGFAAVLMVVWLGLLGGHVKGEEHHLVGDEGGWDPSTNLASWSSGRQFKVGDVIWFTYNAGQESVVELESLGEFSTCDLKNPIKMYTEGLNKVELEGEGSRFFASGNLDSCKKGLKIHVNVHPKERNASEATHDSDFGPQGEGKDDPDFGPGSKGKDDPDFGPGSKGKDDPDFGPGSKGKDDPDFGPGSRGRDVPPGGYEPTPYPSGATHLVGLQLVMLTAMLLCYLGF